MRFLIRAVIPALQGNEFVRDPKFIQTMDDFIKNTNAELAFFTPFEGERSANFIIDVNSADQIPKIAEPFFTAGAKVYFNPIMSFEDLKKGLSQNSN